MYQGGMSYSPVPDKRSRAYMGHDERGNLLCSLDCSGYESQSEPMAASGAVSEALLIPKHMRN